MPVRDAPIEGLIRQVVGTSRKGRKKVIPLVKRLDGSLSACTIRRVYVKAGFSMLKRLKRRMRNNPPNPAQVPLQLNEEWAIDFMSDSLINGRQIRLLNILDPFNRQCKGMFIDYSIPSGRVMECLERSIEKYGQPKYLRTDNGPEFISKQFQQWMHVNGIG